LRRRTRCRGEHRADRAKRRHAQSAEFSPVHRHVFDLMRRKLLLAAVELELALGRRSRIAVLRNGAEGNASGGAVDAARGWRGHARRSVAHGDEGARARFVAAAAVALAAIRPRHHGGALAALALPPVFDDADRRVAGNATLHQLAQLAVVAGRDDHDPRNHVPLLPEGIARMGRLL